MTTQVKALSIILLLIAITLLYVKPIKTYITNHRAQTERLSILSQINQKSIAKGIEEAKKHNVIFVGITRDNAEELKIERQDIERIGKYFKDYKGIFF